MGLVIGLTGGIATGKTTVAEFLGELGAALVDADVVSRDLMRPGCPVYAEVVRSFGQDIVSAGREIDRELLGRRVFADPTLLERLNAITHPAIWAELDRRVAESSRRSSVTVLVAPLLLEHGAAERVDQVWVVWVPPEVQEERLTGRDHRRREDARARIASQMPLEEKVALADVVIDNSADRAATRDQVRRAWAAHVEPFLQ
ncbi:MAG: dephospho-CoA kinase [Armatimonadetes bacterium]|nr:dephospho-CoA kinase [Armatimonadota bacterium]